MSKKSQVSKKLAAYGLSAAAAISGGFLILPHEGAVRNKSGLHTVYKDAVGIPTACYGQTGKDLYGRTISYGMTYTEDECIRMLAATIQAFEKQVDRVVSVKYVSPYQKAAVISFAYNVGLGSLQSSTLLRRLNSGDHFAACEELSKWVYAQKKKLGGLVIRREDEKQWCLGNASAEAKALYPDLYPIDSSIDNIVVKFMMNTTDPAKGKKNENH